MRARADQRHRCGCRCGVWHTQATGSPPRARCLSASARSRPRLWPPTACSRAGTPFCCFQVRMLGTNQRRSVTHDSSSQYAHSLHPGLQLQDTWSGYTNLSTRNFEPSDGLYQGDLKRRELQPACLCILLRGFLRQPGSSATWRALSRGYVPNHAPGITFSFFLCINDTISVSCILRRCARGEQASR